ncbi:MAG: hypothetical protein OQK74_10875 [Gammaproteobacteria bacterium]|nr:hypothetical protein [Gammaproteobacteria bacterium]
MRAVASHNHREHTQKAMKKNRQPSLESGTLNNPRRKLNPQHQKKYRRAIADGVPVVLNATRQI